MDELVVLRGLLKEKRETAISLVDVLKEVKIEPPKSVKATSSPELTAALENAKKATADFGVTSPAARVAWEEYEEIASSGLQNSIGISLLDECSLESGMEACQAMETLDQIMPVLQAINFNK
jgi:hypothetical protein